MYKFLVALIEFYNILINTIKKILYVKVEVITYNIYIIYKPNNMPQ